MPKLKDERFGYLLDPFMRACYVVACMFADFMLVGQFLLVTAGESWSVPVGVAIFIVLVLWEAMLYFHLWKDIKLTITSVEFDKPFVVKEKETAKIDVTIRNDGNLTIEDAIIEIHIDDKKVDATEFTVERKEIKNVTFHWQASPGKHKFGIILRPRELRRRKKEEEPGMTGEFVVRKGKKVVEVEGSKS